MERLTKKFTDGGAYCDVGIEDIGIEGINAPTYVGKAVNKLAEYEDAEEQGLLLRLLCKVGTPVYGINQDCGGDTLDCRCMDCEDCRYLYTYVEQRAFDTYMCDEIGKTVFLTKEEAEQKLAEMKGE